MPAARGSTQQAKARAPPHGEKGPPRQGGRPSRTASEQLGERILDIATQLFLNHGYGATSIESVARRAGVSKRTFYHRFENKPALFGAVVRRVIDRLRPPASTPLLEGADLQQVLRGLARLILRAALSPHAIALHRLIVAESARFPNLAAAIAHEGSTAEAIDLIAGLLEREARAGNIALTNPLFAAQQFLHMVIAVPQHRAMGLGPAMTPAESEAWAGDVVALFLNGCRGGVRAAR
jgi:TetR/AcrR family transcriptional regulator, mexJK operon transcriptional repressor